MSKRVFVAQLCSSMFLLSVILLLAASSVSAQGTSFSYQGKLNDSGNPATGSYDLQFKLFDTATVDTGAQQGSTVTVSTVSVANGIFTVQLDFGAVVFNGSPRFLQIGVRPAGSPNAFVDLSPRQPVTATPYALRSATAASADTAANATQLGGLASSGFIQNTTTQQAATSFNVSGAGTANTLNATMQFNLGGGRILSNGGTNNLFAGINAGAANTGSANSFFGRNAGRLNTSASGNSFFGAFAGDANTTGASNSFFGVEAGAANATASNNAFFGHQAGRVNTTGEGNTFVGWHAGWRSTTEGENTFIGSQAGEFNGQSGGNTAIRNTFVGSRAGLSNTTGASNSFFGNAAGANNSTASQNSFFGDLAGFANATGNSNAFFGYRAGASNSASGNSFFGHNAGSANAGGTQNAVVGAGAGNGNTTGSSNTYLGYNAGFSNTTIGGNTFVGWRAGFSSTGSGNAFFGSGSGSNTTTGGGNSFFAGGGANTTGSSNAFFGFDSGGQNTTGSNNTFLGPVAGGQNTTGNSNVFIGHSAGNQDPSVQVSNSVAIGAFAFVSTSNTIVLGTSAETTRIPGFLKASDLGSGNFGLDVVSSAIGGGVVGRNLYIRQLDQSAALPHLCWKTAPDGVPALLITTCTSASAPSSYKTDLQPFSGGLDTINRLKPMSFTWKEGGRRDFGLSAEDVAAVEPLLVTRSAKGEVEDVKHDNLSALFINAFKEQQAQIKEQQVEIETLKKRQQEFDALKSLVCLDHPAAAVCKPN